MNTTPFAHSMATAIILVGTSSLQNFLNSFQAIILLGNLVALSLMSFMTNPLFPLVVSNCALTCSVISFSCTLLSRYSSGHASTMGSLVILEINATSIYISLSIHKMPPWMWVTSCFKQSLTFLHAQNVVCLIGS
jgi:hypothetical protein